MKPTGTSPAEYLRRMWPAYVVLTASLAAVAALQYQVRESTVSRHRAEFDSACLAIKDRADTHFTFQLALLSGMRGLFAASTDVTPEEFGRYLASLDIHPGGGGNSPAGVPGLRDMGYAVRVPEAAKEAHVAAMRANGFTQYAPLFAGTGPDHFPIAYLDEFTPGQAGALGWDVAWDPERLAALRAACDRGEVRATIPTEVHAREPSRRTRGFVLYLPVYKGGATPPTVEERRAQLIGAVFASFEDEALWHAIQASDRPVLRFSLFDGRRWDPSTRLYPPPAQAEVTGRKPEFEDGFNADAFGRTWGFYFASLPEFEDFPGRRFPALILAFGLSASFGLFFLTRGILRARWRAEGMSREVRASERRFRRIFETIPDLYFQTDLEGRFEVVSPSVHALLGYHPSEIGGRVGLRAYAQPAGRTALLERLVAEGHVTDHEIALLHKDGRVVHASVTAQRTFDEAGRAVGYEGIVRDISARKHAEAETLRASKLESIGLLAGGIAHDFNNILSAILGNLALARFAPHLDSETAGALAEAERAVRRARDLTQQLLTFAKGGAPIRQAASLAEILRETTTFALRGSRIRQELRVMDGLWPAEVDTGQLHRVFHNIAVNAIQAMPEGGVFTVSAENVENPTDTALALPPGPYVHCTFTDSGPGIPAEVLPRVFDPYFTTKKGGNGLGLATVYSIIRRHEGRVTATSEPGRGTTFHVWLPAAPDARIPPPPSSRPVPKGTGDILVMDDEAPIRRILGRFLGRLGYGCVAVSEGQAAIEALRSRLADGSVPFRAAILDLTVPGGLGGRETLPRLRELQPGLVAIVSSGYSSDPVMANYRAHGFDGILAKPYETEDLARVLAEVLAEAGSSAPKDTRNPTEPAPPASSPPA